jgi:uncharacterized protein (TIGR01777 family)
VSWDPKAAAGGDSSALERVRLALDGAHAVVNLAGASIADGRLDERHRARVLESRVEATRAVVEGAKRCESPPSVLVQASASGFYGDCGEERVTEGRPSGSLFLSEVCRRWEAEAARATQLDRAPRLAIARFGVVLGAGAPAWEKLLLPIRLGVGGRLGSGRQWMPWVDLDDVARAVVRLVSDERCTGAYNVSAPEPVRQVDLVRQVASRLHRPAVLPAPAFALKLALGKLADELLLPSCRMVPDRLVAEGFRFERPTLERELEHIL